MVEPVFGLGQWQLVSRNSSEKLRAGTPGTVRIWKLVEQAPAQSVQDAPFVSLGISLCVQKSLLFQVRVTI